MKIVIDHNKCRGSARCVKVCPQRALTVIDGIAVVDPTLCDLDGICIPACPHHAITLEV